MPSAFIASRRLGFDVMVILDVPSFDEPQADTAVAVYKSLRDVGLKGTVALHVPGTGEGVIVACDVLSTILAPATERAVDALSALPGAEGGAGHRRLKSAKSWSVICLSIATCKFLAA